jgi:hypothetical protein
MSPFLMTSSSKIFARSASDGLGDFFFPASTEDAFSAGFLLVGFKEDGVSVRIVSAVVWSEGTTRGGRTENALSRTTLRAAVRMVSLMCWSRNDN